METRKEELQPIIEILNTKEKGVVSIYTISLFAFMYENSDELLDAVLDIFVPFISEN